MKEVANSYGCWASKPQPCTQTQASGACCKKFVHSALKMGINLTVSQETFNPGQVVHYISLKDWLKHLLGPFEHPDYLLGGFRYEESSSPCPFRSFGTGFVSFTLTIVLLNFIVNALSGACPSTGSTYCTAMATKQYQDKKGQLQCLRQRARYLGPGVH